MHKKIILTLMLLVASLGAWASEPDTTVIATDSGSMSMIAHMEAWYSDNMNYFSITALMAAESSILPVPSELVIPPAVYVAMEPGSDLNIFLIILFGTIGALIGASFNYIMAMWLGRMVVYRFADSKLGKLFMLSSDKIHQSEKFFNDHGKTSTFIGRLIPVVRHLISIPAGLAKMNYPTFLLYTFLGAGLWNVILAGLGFWAGENRDLINQYSHELSYVFLGIGVILLVWLILKTKKKK